MWFRNSVVRFHCDNSSVVEVINKQSLKDGVINKQSLKDGVMMTMFRMLAINLLEFSVPWIHMAASSGFVLSHGTRVNM